MVGCFSNTGSTRRQHKQVGKARRRRARRRGAAIIEFAVVAPLFFLLIIGIIEFGRMVMVQQVLTNASREGARRAILEQCTRPEVEALVRHYLGTSSISGPSLAVSVTPEVPLDTMAFGDPVTVSVSIPYAEVTWIPAPWFLGDVTLSASSVMRIERPQ